MDSDDEMFSTDSEMKLMSQDWERNNRSRFNDGFIAGSAVGQDLSLQTAFNVGFNQGFLSNFILSKIRGILSALMAYQASYEGNPITDSILLEAHSLMEEISTLETNAVAEEFLKMSLNQNNDSGSNYNSENLIQMMSSTNIQESVKESACSCKENPSSPNCGSQCCQASPQDIITQPNFMSLDSTPQMNFQSTESNERTLTIEQVNSILLRCPQITHSVNRCKQILKSLNWTDEMIDPLLS